MMVAAIFAAGSGAIVPQRSTAMVEPFAPGVADGRLTFATRNRLLARDGATLGSQISRFVIARSGEHAFLLSKHAIPLMAAGGGGSIILIASQLGRVARPGRPWYCAAKGGLIQLAKAMALDHAGENIRVNSLSPGPVETDRYMRNFPDRDAARRSHHTLTGRLGNPDEIATGAVFLASEESSFMTGSDLLIDGGYTAV